MCFSPSLCTCIINVNITNIKQAFLYYRPNFAEGRLQFGIRNVTGGRRAMGRRVRPLSYLPAPVSEAATGQSEQSIADHQPIRGRGQGQELIGPEASRRQQSSVHP